MANLATDDNGSPVPQYYNSSAAAYQAQTGSGGGADVNAKTAGDVAHDAADSGNPSKIGFKAYDPASLPTNVTAGDRANGISDLKGRQLVSMDEVIQAPGSAIPTKAVLTGGKANAALPSAVDEGDTVVPSLDLQGQTRVIHTEQSIALKASGAVTSSGNSTSVTGTGTGKSLEVLLDVTALASTSGDSLDVLIDASPDNGTTWVNIIHFQQVLGNGSAVKYAASVAVGSNITPFDISSDLSAGDPPRSFLGNTLRERHTVVDGSSSASFTYAVTATLRQ